MEKPSTGEFEIPNPDLLAPQCVRPLCLVQRHRGPHHDVDVGRRRAGSSRKHYLGSVRLDVSVDDSHRALGGGARPGDRHLPPEVVCGSDLPDLRHNVWCRARAYHLSPAPVGGVGGDVTCANILAA